MDIQGYTRLYQESLDGNEEALTTICDGIKEVTAELTCLLSMWWATGPETLAKRIAIVHARALELLEWDPSSTQYSAAVARLVSIWVLELVRQNSNDPHISSFLTGAVMDLSDDELVLANLGRYSISTRWAPILPTLLRYKEPVLDLGSRLFGHPETSRWHVDHPEK